MNEKLPAEFRIVLEMEKIRDLARMMTLFLFSARKVLMRPILEFVDSQLRILQNGNPSRLFTVEFFALQLLRRMHAVRD